MLKILGILLLVASSVASPQDRRSIMVAQYQGPGGNRIIEISPEGKVVWEHKVPSLCVMFQMLPNEHVVYAYGGKPTGVREVDREQKVVWDRVSGCPQVLSCERLPNGNTLLGEQGPCQAVEVDPDGKVIWEITGLANVFEALRLPDGNTLVSCGTQKRVIEVSPAGKVVWELTARDVPDVNLTWVTSLQILKNGNYLIGNFLHGQEGKGAHAFEVTRDKKVVWTFADHVMVKLATMVRALEED